jgi:hypothetical protein
MASSLGSQHVIRDPPRHTCIIQSGERGPGYQHEHLSRPIRRTGYWQFSLAQTVSRHSSHRGCRVRARVSGTKHFCFRSQSFHRLHTHHHPSSIIRSWYSKSNTARRINRIESYCHRRLKKISYIFWDIIRCNAEKFNRRFGGIFRLYLHTRRINDARNKHEASSSETSVDL